jgi:8-oxo-dGTP diphosphatase
MRIESGKTSGELSSIHCLTGRTAMKAPQVGVAVLIASHDRLLLLKRAHVHGEGTWAVPGGHLEPGESLEGCAAREVMEETGLSVTDINFVGITNDVFVPSDRHYITIWMSGCLAGHAKVVVAPEEASEAGWFELASLPDPLFLPLRHLMDGVSYPPSAFRSFVEAQALRGEPHARPGRRRDRNEV